MQHHGEGLRKLTKDDEMVDLLKTYWRNVVLEDEDRQMLEYVEKLTLRPWEMEEADVIALRKVGFNDAAILDINQVTSYYAYVNRLADGLGIEMEGYWENED